jgi:hypothetical protein
LSLPIRPAVSRRSRFWVVVAIVISPYEMRLSGNEYRGGGFPIC